MFHRFSAWSSRANVPRAFAWSIDGTIAALSSATVFPAKSEKYEQRTAAEPVFGTDRIAPAATGPATGQFIALPAIISSGAKDAEVHL